MATNGKIPQKLIKDQAVGAAELSTAVAGDGISGGGGTALAVDLLASGGLKFTTAQLGIEPNDFAGTGLEDDGSDNLRLAAQGVGIAGGGGTTLSFDTTANLDMSVGGGIHTHSPDTLQVVGSPNSANDGVNKAYVDSLISGQLWKPSARVATVAALPAVTYNNGTGGVGATLTASALGVLTVDGVATVLGDRIVVKDQVAGLQNGIYEVTTEGTAGVAFILTRAPDSDNSPSNELEAAAIFVQAGTTNANVTLTQTATSVVVGTTALVFVQSAGASAASAGAGMTASGNVFNVGDANKGVQVNADNLQVDANEIAGNGLAQRAGAGNEHLLDVKPDVTTGANTQPVSSGANGVGVDINAIAGTGLEADGSANLRIAAAAAGNGLTGGAGSALSIQPDTVATDDAAAVVVGANGLSINGDLVSIDQVPTNYTRDTGGIGVDVKDLASHLLGIDNALAGLSSTPRQHALTTEAITGTDTAMASQLTNTPVSNASVQLFYYGVLLEQGAGKDYTVSGKVITWLAATGVAPDQAVSEPLVAVYLSSD